MGFWHTGYMDFHEPVGLDGSYPPNTTAYTCQICDSTFGNQQDLQAHRFEAHPFERPLLFIRGLEVGSTPLRITRALQPEEVVASRFDHARINGTRIPAKELGRKLSKITNDRVAIELANENVLSRFDITFEIASRSDLAGVDSCFLAVARRRRLDIRAIEDFILEARNFASALGYCEGVCDYLYGVLAKERAQDTRLTYEKYREKFGRAADLLKDFQTPLSQAIRALVAFHFNHFRDSALIGSNLRVGAAAGRFGGWLGHKPFAGESRLISQLNQTLDPLLTDLETEKIITWVVAQKRVALRQLPDIEANLKQDIAEFDRAKLHMILAELYLGNGEGQKAKRHARELLHAPALGHWAERLLDRVKAEGSSHA
jgi:hypothetical protein